MFAFFPHLFYSPAFTIAYLLGSAIAGVFGRNTKIGFWGSFFASLIFTPIISLLYFFFTAPRSKNE